MNTDQNAPLQSPLTADRPFTIRPFAKEDLDRVLAIERACYSSPWSDELFLRETRNPFSTLDLLWNGDQLAGYLCSWLVAGELHILNIATSPQFRRLGVAAALLRHVLGRAVREGAGRAYLEVRVSNEAAIELYHRFAFHSLYRRPGYYPDGEDALVMELTVTGPDALTPWRERTNEEL